MVRRIESPLQDELGLPPVRRIWTPPESFFLPTSFPELHGFVALDLETKDPGIAMKRGSSWARVGEGFICGASIYGENVSGYFPVEHAEGNLDFLAFLRWITTQAAKPDVIFIMANASYDVGWLQRFHVKFANAPVDVQTMAYLLDEHRRSYSLGSLARDYLGEGKSSDTLAAWAKEHHIPKPMENMEKMPSWAVAPYAIDDARLTYSLYHKLMPEIEKEDLQKVLDLESECTMVVTDMRKLGVRVDLDRAAELKRLFTTNRNSSLLAIHRETGVNMSPFENEAAIKALRVENPNVVLGETGLGNDSVRREVLESINSPVSKSILMARKYDKAVGTFIEGYLEGYAYRGRIHAEFHPTRHNDEDNDSMFGTGSGRFASSNPNLQNIPIRDPDIGPAIRSCFVPEPGEDWLKLDYASQEPRLTVHFAALARQNGAVGMVARFRSNPMTDLHGECAALMGIERRHAKTINLGLAYGMQGASLCRQLGLPTKMITLRNGRELEVAGDEGQRLLDRHASSVPFMKGLFELAKDTAKRRGYVKTILGRRIRFEKYPDGNYARIHKALNGVIQGSAADQMKMALIELRKAGIPINITVHDEADKSLPRGGEGERLKAQIIEIMENCLPLEVPVIAEASVGANWGSLS